MNNDTLAYTGPIVTRQEAKSLGLKRYFTGKPCKHGHISERMAGNSGCLECHRKVSIAYNNSNQEKLLQYYKDNFETISKYQRKYREENAETLAKYNKEWRRKKPWKYREAGARRKARKLQATPPWADLDAITEIYQNCPDGYHVDHYYPLCHKDFCGLHCEANLRTIPALENMQKNNTRPEEFYGKNPPHD